jgi:hypothetical protein
MNRDQLTETVRKVLTEEEKKYAKLKETRQRLVSQAIASIRSREYKEALTALTALQKLI